MEIIGWKVLVFKKFLIDWQLKTFFCVGGFGTFLMIIFLLFSIHISILNNRKIVCSPLFIHYQITKFVEFDSWKFLFIEFKYLPFFHKLHSQLIWNVNLFRIKKKNIAIQWSISNLQNKFISPLFWDILILCYLSTIQLYLKSSFSPAIPIFPFTIFQFSLIVNSTSISHLQYFVSSSSSTLYKWSLIYFSFAFLYSIVFTTPFIFYFFLAPFLVPFNYSWLLFIVFYHSIRSWFCVNIKIVDRRIDRERMKAWNSFVHFNVKLFK